MIAATPNAMAKVWTMSPVHSPSVMSIPERIPFIADWVRTKMLSGPGVNERSVDVATNASSDSLESMDLVGNDLRV